MDDVHFFQIKLNGGMVGSFKSNSHGIQGKRLRFDDLQRVLTKSLFQAITFHGFEKVFVVRRSLHVPNTIRAYSSLC